RTPDDPDGETSLQWIYESRSGTVPAPRRSAEHNANLAQHDEKTCATELLTMLSHSSSRSEEHTSELQSRVELVCRLLLEKKEQKSEAHAPAERDEYPVFCRRGIRPVRGQATRSPRRRREAAPH